MQTCTLVPAVCMCVRAVAYNRAEAAVMPVVGVHEAHAPPVACHIHERFWQQTELVAEGACHKIDVTM